MIPIPEEVIGLWRFREVGKPRLWAATFAVDGSYYDTLGHRTLDKCVKKVAHKVKMLSQQKARLARAKQREANALVAFVTR